MVYKDGIFFKASAFAIACIYFATNCVLVHATDFQGAEALPKTLGSVRKITPSTTLRAGSPTNRKIVIHIQDVHGNSEAQTNIAKAVRELIDQRKIDLVALEGAFGPMNFSWYQHYPHQDSVKAVADYLLKEKRISGPVHVAMTRGGVRFVGIDHQEHYDANVAAVRTSARLAPLYKKKLRTIIQTLEAEKSQAFNPDLKAFDDQMASYRAGSLSWGDYIFELARRVPDLAASVQAYATALKMERGLNFNQVERERAQFIAELVPKMRPAEKDELASRGAAFRSGALTPADFCGTLKDLGARHGVALSRYPAMTAYIRYVLLSESLDAEGILKEAVATEKKICATLAKTEEERRLLWEARHLYLCKKLLEFALTKEEWGEYERQKLVIGNWKLDQGVINKSSSIQLPITIYQLLNLSSFERFYREAEARDEAMAQNLEKAMAASHANIAVLVTGGFHTDGILRRLQPKGFTVVSYVPKISKIDDSNGSAYLSVFTQQKTPLDKLFAGEQLFLATLAEPNREIVGPMIELDHSLDLTGQDEGEKLLANGGLLRERRHADKTIEEFDVQSYASFRKQMAWIWHGWIRKIFPAINSSKDKRQFLNGTSIPRLSLGIEELDGRSSEMIRWILRTTSDPLERAQMAAALDLSLISGGASERSPLRSKRSTVFYAYKEGIGTVVTAKTYLRWMSERPNGDHIDGLAMELAHLQKRAFPNLNDADGRWRNKWNSFLRHTSYEVLLLLDDRQQILGFASINTTKNMLEWLAIDPAQQGTRKGHFLLGCVFDWAREAGYPSIFWHAGACAAGFYIRALMTLSIRLVYQFFPERYFLVKLAPRLFGATHEEEQQRWRRFIQLREEEVMLQSGLQTGGYVLCSWDRTPFEVTPHGLWIMENKEGDRRNEILGEWIYEPNVWVERATDETTIVGPLEDAVYTDPENPSQKLRLNDFRVSGLYQQIARYPGLFVLLIGVLACSWFWQGAPALRPTWLSVFSLVMLSMIRPVRGESSVIAAPDHLSLEEFEPWLAQHAGKYVLGDCVKFAKQFLIRSSQVSALFFKHRIRAVKQRSLSGNDVPIRDLFESVLRQNNNSHAPEIIDYLASRTGIAKKRVAIILAYRYSTDVSPNLRNQTGRPPADRSTNTEFTLWSYDHAHETVPHYQKDLAVSFGVTESVVSHVLNEFQITATPPAANATNVEDGLLHMKRRAALLTAKSA